MEIAKSGGIMLFIINRITSGKGARRWIKKKWVDKRILEDIFDILTKRGIEVYVHFDFDEPWATLDDDLALFEEIGFVEVESELIGERKDSEESQLFAREKIKICLTESGREKIGGSRLYFAEHEKMIEEVINGIALQ